MMECARQLRTLDGSGHAMAGLLDATAIMGEPGRHWPAPLAHTTAQGELRGHVFHYGTLAAGPTLKPSPLTQPRRYGGPEAVYRAGSLRASFFHAYFASKPQAVEALLG